MKIHNIGYLFKEGIKNLWKNRTMSIASIGVLISCLLLTGCAVLISMNLTSMMSSIEGNNSVTIYLNEGLPSLSAIEVGEQIRSIENISECNFVPKDDALADMMERLGDDGTILNGLDGDDNFLPDAYTISMYDLSLYDDTMNQIQAIEGVDRYTDYSHIATMLSNIDLIVRVASLAIIVILGIVSLFIISNTVKVTMFSRRTEISIMKSVGATNGFVRIPFIVEGMIIGLISGGVSVTVLLLAYDRAVMALYNIVPFLTAVDIDPYIGYIIAAYAVVGALFGLFGGSISIGKYLNNEGENAVA
ncbi:permease-like cell division protein FtsX [Anaeromassilibacillus senegalensis]|uniref:Cell division protein FtsX n=1 Tax=Anaeromassilibacillus senegalensis TaxID=1673717 RepID=A0ABS9CPY5_9FIRM|nr:permease-like cell division protein FtsX [Anaeromassilibacillus senegalensis]MCF2652232.1 ABC transporter permease [Anaeromassilibacillus senegalensis]